VLLTFLILKKMNSCKIKDYGKYIVNFGVIDAYKLIDKKGYLLTISPGFGASGCPKESKTLLGLEKQVIMTVMVLVGLLLLVAMVVLYAPRGER